MLISFKSRQSNKKISVNKLFPVRGKQKNGSLNNFTTQTCVKKCLITYIMPKHVGRLVGWLHS